MRNQALGKGGSDQTTSPQSASSYEFRYDAITGIFRVRMQGYWSLSDVEDYIAQALPQFESVRRRKGMIRVVADRRGCPVQSAEVTSQMQKAIGEVYRPEDRLAFIVDSQLVRLQARRLIRHPGAEVFLCVEEALEWVVADT